MMTNETQISPYYSLKNIERLLKIKRAQLRKVANRSGAYYDPYDELQIKSNGKRKWRHIDNPKRELKYIQGKILKKILLSHLLKLPTGMIGGVSGKSIKDNALPHLKQEMVVTIDIKDCFPHTTDSMVFKVWRNTIGLGSRQAELFTKLSTFRTILPQGAPTSTALCNLVLLPLFEDIRSYADKHYIAFTLYVDDVTISGETDSVLSAIAPIVRIIQKYGYGVRREKIGIMPANRPQRVTGLNANKSVNIARQKIQEARNKILTIAKRGNGITKREINSVNGDIQHIKTISKIKAEKLKEFAAMLLSEEIILPDEVKQNPLRRKCRHHKTI